MTQQSTASQDIFKLVKDPAEKAEIYKNLLVSQRPISVKHTEGESSLFSVKAMQVTPQTVICEFVGEAPKIPAAGKCITQFTSGPDKYMMQTDFTVKTTQLVINISVELYRLQRREDFRIHLPKGYDVKFAGHEINGKQMAFGAGVFDLSAGGCRLYVPAKTGLKANDNIKGQLQLANREPMAFEGSIRHLTPSKDDATMQYAGVLFTKMSDMSKDKLANIVMELYRELFAKLKNQT